jgi:hypothetical protein
MGEKRLKHKRIIAREWLIFLFFFFVSPIAFAVHSWSVENPKVLVLHEVPEGATFDYVRYDVTTRKFIPPKVVENKLPKGFVPDNDSPEDLKAKLKSERPPVKIRGLSNGKLLGFPASVSDAEIDSAVARELHEIASARRRLFWNFYLPSAFTDLSGYIAIVFTYPLFLVARSVVWSIRTLKRSA